MPMNEAHKLLALLFLARNTTCSTEHLKMQNHSKKINAKKTKKQRIERQHINHLSLNQQGPIIARQCCPSCVSTRALH